MSDRPIIVCVDDDEPILRATQRCLRREPFEVRTTLSAREAIAWIAADDVAVLVSDYEMPEMTGARLAGVVRRLRPETVRILLTGKCTLETAVDGINQGEIFRFIAKPFDAEALRTAVLAGVERHRELLALVGDSHRRDRRDALNAALEVEHPGISKVDRAGDLYIMTADPWSELAALGLDSLALAMTRK